MVSRLMTMCRCEFYCQMVSNFSLFFRQVSHNINIK